MGWVSTADVEGALGLPPASAVDDAWLLQCTQAANVVAFRRRRAAGHVDDSDVSPDDAVKLGTVSYAVSLYRSRGAVDGMASFEELGQYVPTGASWGEILRLWACGRPAVG